MALFVDVCELPERQRSRLALRFGTTFLECTGANSLLQIVEDALDGDSVASIRRMLEEMTRAGLVRLVGERRWARWYATPIRQNEAPDV